MQINNNSDEVAAEAGVQQQRTQIEGGCGVAGHHRHGGEEAHRLLDDPFGELQVVQVLVVDEIVHVLVREYQFHLLKDTFLVLGVHGQHQNGVADHQGGRLVALQR